MKILLTGGTGMVGRNILDHQKINQHYIISPSSKDLDLTDRQSTENYFVQHKPDLVIHAAGFVGGIQANIKQPVKFFVNNLDMGKNVVLAAVEAGVKQLINLGSSCMYPRNAINPLTEEMILTGELEPTNEGYALAKIATAKLCEYLSREDELLCYKTIIPCNIYGLYDKFDPKHSHLIPAIIHKLYQAKKHNQNTVSIWGDGHARREFMFATDLADCIDYALSNFDTMPIYMNAGLGTDYTINDYYNIAAGIVGYDGQFEHDLSKPVGMMQKLVSIDKAKNWGWSPKTSLEDGISKTFQYYLKHVAN